jgi:hypothetical protein
MLVPILAVAGALVAASAALALLVPWGFRARSPILIEPLLFLQRRVINPRQLRTAGTPGSGTSVVRHEGRVSGRAYETPVDAVATDDGFVIALPYGMRSQWVRNVLARGSAAIVSDGRSQPVERPELVPLQSVEGLFTPGTLRSLRRFGVDQCLRVRRSEALRTEGVAIS